MDEYTFDSVLIDPNKEGIDSLIGKEVYFHDNPSFCIMKANQKSTECLGVLVKIVKDSANPFRVEQSGSVYSRSCIIPKKEEPKPEYVPFKNVDEFLSAYCHIVTRDLDGVHRYLSTNGIWLKEKGTDDSDTFCMVHELWKEGVFVGHAEVMLDDGHASTDYTSWRELYLDYTFLDGSPCGKVEDSNG